MIVLRPASPPLLLLVVLATACAPSEGGRGDPPRDGDGAPGPASAVPLERLGAASPGFALRRERGLGVLHIDPEALLVRDGPDTLVVLAKPSEGAAPVARLVAADGAWTLEAALPARLGAALEFAYEELGLPVVGRRTDGWVSVLYATDGEGRDLVGWARPGSGGARLLPWPDHLPGQPLFFVGDPRFHASPDGPLFGLPLRPDRADPTGADYVLWPLDTPRGPWLQVEVVTPSDYCFDPPAPRRDTAWIRYLDAAGRPLTWFHTRGC